MLILAWLKFSHDHVVGSLGYLALEHTRTSKVTTRTYVFVVWVLLVQVACAKRIIEPKIC